MARVFLCHIPNVRAGEKLGQGTLRLLHSRRYGGGGCGTIRISNNRGSFA